MRRFFNLLSALAVGALFSTGCRTLSPISTDEDSHTHAFDDALLETRAKAHANYAAAVIHDLNDEPELALEAYRKAALLDPADETLTLDVSRRLILARQPDKALELLRSAASRRDASGGIFARLGFVYLQLGKDAEAIQAGRTAVKKSPHLLAGYQNLFQGHLVAGRDAEALSVLREAAKQPETDSAFLIGLFEMYASYVAQFPTRRDAIKPDALAVLNRAAGLEPASTHFRLRLADGFSMMDQPDKAAQIYEALLKQLEDLPMLQDSVRAKLADIYLRGRDFGRAATQLGEIIRADPSNAQAYYLLGSIAYGEKRWQEAAEYFEKAILFSPGFEQAYYDLAGARIATGEDTRALTALENARTRFSQNFLMEYLMGVAYGQAKAYTESVQHFTAAEVIAQATDANRLTKDFYFHVAVVHERKGDHAQAAEYFQKAINLSPDFAEALNYLGYMWADRGENLDTALELIERALKIEPDSAAYLDSMGWVLFKLGQPEPALRYILKALELSDEPDAEILNHLGDIYAALKQTDKARDAWQKSLAVEPNVEIQKKLSTEKTD